MKIFIGESFPFLLKIIKSCIMPGIEKQTFSTLPSILNLFIHYSDLSTKTLRQKTHEPSF